MIETMSGKIKDLGKPLSKDEVELRIGTTAISGFSLLPYKTARTDVNRLNSVCGLNWKNRHFYDDKELICCEISILENDKWIGRSDVGKESYTEKEKGSYSDSFKRAGYRWGIGSELYKSPFIWVQWNMKKNEKTGKYNPVDFFPSNLSINKYEVKEGKLHLSIQYNGSVVFSNIGDKKISQNPNNLFDTDDDFRMTEKQKKEIVSYLTKIPPDSTIRLNQWLKKPHTKDEAKKTLISLKEMTEEI